MLGLKMLKMNVFKLMIKKSMVMSLLLKIILVSNLQAQEANCGTEATDYQLEFMNNIQTTSKIRSSVRIGGLVNIPVKFFILRRSDGSGGINPARIPILLNEVNEVYEPANMLFFEISSPTFVDNDDFFDMSQSEENTLANNRDVSGVINIYVTGNLESGRLCGYTRFPPSSDRIFLNQACADDVSTTAHELGHYFTLFHTHGKTNNGTTDELVSGVNCDILGDNVCDTPADPNLTGLVSGACAYTGNLRDREGNLFNPNPNNIMAYSLDRCQNFFSQGQYERMRNGFENGRDYLNFNFAEFNVNFNAENREGCGPLNVQFSDNTIGGVSRQWQFEGADVESSFSSSPNISYTQPGVYDVFLSVTNNAGETAELTRTNYITVLDPAATVDQNGASERFSSDNLPAAWSIINPDKTLSFERSPVSFDENGGSLYFNNFENDAEVLPQIDEVEITNLRLNEISSINLRFNYAYATRTDPDETIEPIRYDTLEIGYRLECDEEFTSIYKVGGNELSTVETQEAVFVPSFQAEWSLIEILIEKQDIPGFASSDIFNPIIRNISDNGNNLYIDNIELIPDFSLDSLEFFRTLEVTPQSVSLRWFNPAINELGVVVQRSLDGVNFTDLIELGVDSNGFDDTTIPDGTPTVYYRAASFNSRDISGFTPIITVPLIVSSIDGDLEDISEQNIQVFPNPSETGLFNLKLSGELFRDIESVQAYNNQGKSVGFWTNSDLRFNSVTETFSLSLADLPSGTYFVVTSMKDSQAKVLKVVK